jgi:hypothetical protein
MATIASIGTLATGTVNLCTAQAGNGVTTNIADRGSTVGAGDRPSTTGPALLRIVTTVGATPTCTYAVEASANGTDWFAAPIADPATPETVSVATFAITTATTTIKFLRPSHAWRYLRVTMSANTNVTSSIDLWTF